MGRDRDRDRDKKGRGGDKGKWVRKQRTKVCPFCKDKSEWVDYKDVQLLRKFLSDRGKIRARTSCVRTIFIARSEAPATWWKSRTATRATT